MYILIPVENENGMESKITTVPNVKKWALVDFEANEVKFYDDFRETDADFIEYVILDNKFENSIDFINEGMMCLMRREEKTVEELLSAFRFKELDEMNF